ncbi:MAG: helix-turn-helix domain-containing protein [Sedimenticola sp.]
MAAYLLQTMQEQEASDSFKFSVPKSMLASRLSMKPETFSRILKSLIDGGVISVSGDSVTVLNEAKLKDSAEITVYSESVSLMPRTCNFRTAK